MSNNKMEIKHCKTEIKADSDNEMKFSGYASIFGNIDSYDDIMEKGAFTKTIKENKSRIRILAYHDMWNVIGKPTKLEEDSKGLYFEGKISNTTTGRDMYTLIKDKAVNEMSIGYNVVKFEYDKDKNLRKLKEVKLWEISPVTWGANDKAKIKHLFDNNKYDILESEVKRLEALILKLSADDFTLNKEKEPPPIFENDPETIQSLINVINKYK